MSAKSQYRSYPMSERVLRQSIAPDLHLRRDGKRAELLHKREEIAGEHFAQLKIRHV
jgi:hypothetical protein